MSYTPLHIGSTPIHPTKPGGIGDYVRLHDETWSKITGVDDMDPFLMTVVSSSDHWMFIASNGGLTAGRKNPDNALFPYYTDDKIMDSPETTGSKTIFRVQFNGRIYLWEPFSERYAGVYALERNLYKNKFGSKVRFEEVNRDLGLIFRYTWTFSDAYGFVKYAELENERDVPVPVECLDGIQNLLPFGINHHLQATKSTLVDAYKKNELVPDAGLGIFSLSAMIVDKAEPSEALRATTVWSKGLPNPSYLLSSQQLHGFRRGKALEQETFTKAVKAAYFVHSNTELAAKSALKWCLVAEVGQSSAEIANLQVELLQNTELLSVLEADVKRVTKNLERLVGLADGLQKGRDKLSTTRHYSNVLFNIMRGGVFEDQYFIRVHDLMEHVRGVNVHILNEGSSFFEKLPPVLRYDDLVLLARQSGHRDLIRICLEYLPISFSRRHGDPSRPWNSFNIEVEDEQGHKIHNYEGNWRDIFQNWEALAYSFPVFVEGMMATFLNASTIDGYNPYRITSKGIDWEVIEPDDPWSYIGYWGDHQIIYLLKLLEHADRHYPGKLARLLTQRIFVFADVPYRIRSYDAIKNNPNDTILFDHELHQLIHARSKEIGSDGKMIWRDGRLLPTHFAEKLLIMILTKLYNFVPDGGIWLNTQRPEWNDANNALVGNGLSVVTLNYLRRCMMFTSNLLGQMDDATLEVNGAVAALFHDVNRIFTEAPSSFSPQQREVFVDALGRAGEKYRTSAYAYFREEPAVLGVEAIRSLLDVAIALAEKSITRNKRPDGLFHSYNLLSFGQDGARVSHLYEMLEGQVAALSSGLLSPEMALEVLDALKKSAMYREDQYSYMLYPDRELAPFIQKNTIPAHHVESSKLMEALVEKGERSLVEADGQGVLHFAGGLHNAQDVSARLEALKDSEFADLAREDAHLVQEAFEAVFNHVAFTGRSGTFYGYEGLGCIYWHMVSKLLLAVQENITLALELGSDKAVVGRLIEHFYEIRAGIGLNKSPGLYGAFPTDAYSHTPRNAGAQQPGLTGQVKEDILNRWAVLGIQVRDGQIFIHPFFLHREELLSKDEDLSYVGVDGAFHRITVQAGEMAFTYCGTLFRYAYGKTPKVEITLHSNEVITSQELKLSHDLSASIFGRKGQVKQVYLEFPFL